MADLLQSLADLPSWLLVAVLALGAATENVFPPVPADTFVVLGAFLAARGAASPLTVFLATWIANVASALFVFEVARRRGLGFFRRGWGRVLLNRRQIAWLRAFHGRWGVAAIFLSRFLPGVRAVVPIFAGVARQPFLKVAVPMAVASGLWYGGLVVAGTTAGRNLDAILDRLDGMNRVLLGAALAVIGLLVWAWMRSRRPRP